MVHDPDRRDAMREAASRGGKAAVPAKERQAVVRAEVKAYFEGRPPEDTPPMPTNLDEAARWLSWLGWAVASGKMDQATARESANAMKGFTHAVIKRDLERRIKELEARLKAADK